LIYFFIALAKNPDAVLVLLKNGAQTEALNAVGKTSLHKPSVEASTR
jgi:hypothetical protein